MPNRDSSDAEASATLAAELESHLAACPACRQGDPAACPVALALAHALAAGARFPSPSENGAGYK